MMTLSCIVFNVVVCYAFFHYVLFSFLSSIEQYCTDLIVVIVYFE